MDTVVHTHDVDKVSTTEDRLLVNLTIDGRIVVLGSFTVDFVDSVLHQRRRIELHVAAMEVFKVRVLTEDDVQTSTAFNVDGVAREPTHTLRGDEVRILGVVADVFSHGVQSPVVKRN